MIAADRTGSKDRTIAANSFVSPRNTRATAHLLAAVANHVATARADAAAHKVSDASTVAGASRAVSRAAPKNSGAPKSSAESTVPGAANTVTTAAPKIVTANSVASISMVVPSANEAASAVPKVFADDTLAARILFANANAKAPHQLYVCVACSLVFGAIHFLCVYRAAAAVLEEVVVCMP